MKIDEIKMLIEWCRNLGAKKIKLGSVFVEFSDKVEDFQITKESETMKTENMPTEDELLYYSTEHYDLLKEQRLAASMNPPANTSDQ